MPPHPTSRIVVLVLDNGGDSLRIGFAGEPQPRLTVPNCQAKIQGAAAPLVADELDTIRDASKVHFTRPHDRGYVTNWEVQDRVWKRVFKQLHVEPSKTILIVTEAPFAPYQLSAMMMEMIFEEYGFAGCVKVPSATLSAYHYRYQKSQQMHQQQQRGRGSRSSANGHHADDARSSSSEHLPDCVTVVDAGFSFTHIIPYYQGRVLASAVKRINVGGKLLTNLLKETVSFTKVNMMDEFPTTNDAKEKMCFVSQDLATDIKAIRAKDEELRKYFLLPDYVNRVKGEVLPPDSELLQKGGAEEGEKGGHTILMLDVERFSTPEVLFHPSDIEIKQAGIPEAIVQAVEECDIGLRAALYGNVLLTGGSCKFPGFRERVEKDLRTMVPQHIDIKVTLPDDALEYGWKGGSLLGSDSSGGGMQHLVYRREQGLQGCEAHFSVRW